MNRWLKTIFLISTLCWLAACKPPEVGVTAVPPTRTPAPTMTVTSTATSAALSAGVTATITLHTGQLLCIHTSGL